MATNLLSLVIFLASLYIINKVAGNDIIYYNDQTQTPFEVTISNPGNYFNFLLKYRIDMTTVSFEAVTAPISRCPDQPGAYDFTITYSDEQQNQITKMLKRYQPFSPVNESECTTECTSAGLNLLTCSSSYEAIRTDAIDFQTNATNNTFTINVIGPATHYPAELRGFQLEGILRTTGEPTSNPSMEPTIEPTISPSNDPSLEPTSQPSNEALINPTKDPTITTNSPSSTPTDDSNTLEPSEIITSSTSLKQTILGNISVLIMFAMMV